MLLKLNDLIINTDQIVKAEFNRKTGKPSLTIFFTDGGYRPNPPQISFHNLVMITGDDAEFMWIALSQISEEVSPRASNPPK